MLSRSLSDYQSTIQIAVSLVIVVIVVIVVTEISHQLIWWDIFDYHWLSLIIIDYHWLSLIIINYHWLSLISLIIIDIIDYLKIWKKYG